MKKACGQGWLHTEKYRERDPEGHAALDWTLCSECSKRHRPGLQHFNRSRSALALPLASPQASVAPVCVAGPHLEHTDTHTRMRVRTHTVAYQLSPASSSVHLSQKVKHGQHQCALRRWVHSQHPRCLCSIWHPVLLPSVTPQTMAAHCVAGLGP